jgi:hypothetical protein
MARSVIAAGKLIDAFLTDHGRIHIGQKQLLAAIRRLLDDDVNARSKASQLFCECALVYSGFRGKEDIGGVGPKPPGFAGIPQHATHPPSDRRVEST